MSIAISDLIASAETIRTNNLPDSNTPELVGSTMKNALLLLQDLQSAKDGPYYIDVSISDAQNLPSSPTDQQKLTAYLIGSYVYVWNGTSWTPKQFVGPVGEKGDKGDSGVTDAASVVAISDYTAGDGADATKVYVGTANALKNLYLYACKLIADKYKKSNPNDEEGNVVDTNTIVSVEDNSEFIKVDVDKGNKILGGFKVDGDYVFGAGVPTQIQVKAKEIAKEIASNLDTANAIDLDSDIDGSIYASMGKDGNIDVTSDDEGAIYMIYDTDKLDIKDAYEDMNGNLIVEQNKVMIL